MKRNLKILGLFMVIGLVVGIGAVAFSAANDERVPIVGGTCGGVAYLKYCDEDAQTSNDACCIPSQQSVKAYADSGTQTLTNKTLSSPTISGDVTQGTLAGGVPLVLKLDITSVSTGTTTSATPGSTVVATLLDTGGALEILCGGTIVNANGTNTLTLLGGTTAVATVVNENADTGDFIAQFSVSVVAGGTVVGVGKLATDNAAAEDVDFATTALDVSAVTTWTLQMANSDASDSMAMGFCNWRYLP